MTSSKRVFQTKTFDRWARKILTDSELCKAAREVIAGQFEADLGAGICKKRIAMQGQGKSGAARTLIAHWNKDAVFFLAGREKSDPGKDFADKEVAVAKVVAKGLQSANQSKLAELLTAGVLKEICRESEASSTQEE